MSRLVLNPGSRRAQRESADPYQMHRTVMRAFPETLPADERVLFRLDSDRQTGVLTLLAQSHYSPNWSWLDNIQPSNYLLPISDPNPWVKPFDLVFATDQQLIFRLRANPTIKRDGKRIALVRDEDQFGWLFRKAQTGGFAVQSARIQDQGFVQGKTREQHSLTLITIQYDGVLQVTDPQAFWHSVVDGIGPAKGLGFGLLSLAPAS
ncbi:MAG TPA: type I-E CRISPR-associated protein Cas6/Cse3/CasE [Aggregatilineaceae bacterium]|nr:type I-E CRISPR-associated protein Cas6/Cse3/CasE [Aggregatilineaceae bacterium]